MLNSLNNIQILHDVEVLQRAIFGCFLSSKEGPMQDTRNQGSPFQQLRVQNPLQALRQNMNTLKHNLEYSKKK